jgi:tetratricopeptide (TPR) repeat protein
VQQLAQYEGYINEERDLVRMAQMFMVQGLPQRGAAVMKKGLEDGTIPPKKENYQTYSDTLLQSREWALSLEPIAKAAELSDDGTMWVRHAQVQLQLGNWSEARNSLNRAFQKGKIPDEGQAHVLFGIAAANDKLWDAATGSFRRAASFPGTADVAAKWMAFVEREKMRFATPEEQAKMAAERAAAAAAEGDGAEKKADGTTTQASATQAAGSKDGAESKAGAEAAKSSAKN